MAEPRKFEIVQDEESPPDPHKTGFDTDILFLSLQALSKRTIVALSNLFCLLTVGSVFIIFYRIAPEPDTYQIVNATIYAVFVLAANAIVRRM